MTRWQWFRPTSETSVLDAYRALLRRPDEDGCSRRSHLTQPGAGDRHPRVWLRLMDAYTAELGLRYDERVPVNVIPAPDCPHPTPCASRGTRRQWTPPEAHHVSSTGGPLSHLITRVACVRSWLTV